MDEALQPGGQLWQLEASRTLKEPTIDRRKRDRESLLDEAIDFRRKTGSSDRAFVCTLAASLCILPALE